MTRGGPSRPKELHDGVAGNMAEDSSEEGQCLLTA